MPVTRDPALALVLSGGGARGAFEAGAVEAIEAAGLRPGVVSGTSAGALTGAAVACGWAPQRELLVHELAELGPDATYHRPVEILTVLPEEPIAGLGDLLDFEPAVARELVANGRRATRTALEDARWN